ncbi:MAG TPA: transposase [Ignavibacteriaceae bacterium]|nr:transposase [Ignavibacteriaceae bacterium]
MGRRGRLNLTEESIFFVTTTIVDFTRVFIKDIYCDLLIRNILYYQKKYHFIILAYVIMPSHFHWIIIVNSKYGTISDIMRDIKKYSAWDIMEEVEKNDENLTTIFKNASKGFQNQKRKFWMQRFDDEVIRNEKMFWTKLHYIHSNPVEAGLVGRPEDFKYSSARHYINGDHSVLSVDTEYAGIEIK